MESKLPYYSEAGTYHGKSSQFDPRLAGRAIKSSKFTNKIANHGFWRDTSIAAATREQKRHDVVLKRKHGTMEKLSAQFELETKRVEKLQKQLAESQNEMALIAMEKYTATFLQSVARGWLGRIRWYRLNKLRVLVRWISFRLYFRKRQAAWKIIRKCLASYIGKRRLGAIMMYVAAVKRVQRQYRMRYRTKLAVVRVKTLLFWNDVKHLAVARAKLKISKYERAKAAMKTVMHGFIRRQRQRRYNARCYIAVCIVLMGMCYVWTRLGNPQGYNRIFYSLFFYPADQLKRITGEDVNTHKKVGSGVIVEEGDEEEEAEAEAEAEAVKRPILSIEQLEQKIQLIKTLKTSQDTMAFIRKRAEVIKAKRAPLKSPSRISLLQRSQSTGSAASATGAGKAIGRVSLFRRANSQLDTVSLLKNEFNTMDHRKTIVPTPYALRDTFRIRSIYDAVIFLKDLAVRASLNPELVGDSLELGVGAAEDERSPTSRRGMGRSRAMSIKPFADHPLPETPAPSLRATAGVRSGRRPSNGGKGPAAPAPKERKASGSGSKELGITPGRRKGSGAGLTAAGGAVINTNVVTAAPHASSNASKPAPRRRGSVMTPGSLAMAGGTIPKPPPIVTSTPLPPVTKAMDTVPPETPVVATEPIAGPAVGTVTKAEKALIELATEPLPAEPGPEPVVAAKEMVQVSTPEPERVAEDVKTIETMTLSPVQSAAALQSEVTPIHTTNVDKCEEAATQAVQEISVGSDHVVPPTEKKQEVVVTYMACPEESESSSESESESSNTGLKFSSGPLVVAGASSIRRISAADSNPKASRASSTSSLLDNAATDAESLAGDSSVLHGLDVLGAEGSVVLGGGDDDYADEEYEAYDEDFETFEDDDNEEQIKPSSQLAPTRPPDPKPSSASARRRGSGSTNQ
jgi:hypothetical protein